MNRLRDIAHGSTLVLLGAIVCGTANQGRANNFQFPAWFNPQGVVTYKIAKTEETNIGTTERRVYRIVVSSDLSGSQVKSTLVKVVAGAVAKNPDLDVVTVFAYDRIEEIESFYTVGRLVWAPWGRPGKVTPRIASENDRTEYQFKIDLKASVGKGEPRPIKRKFQVYDAVEEALWANPDVPEDRIIERVAKQLEMTPEDVSQTHTEVLWYRMR